MEKINSNHNHKLLNSENRDANINEKSSVAAKKNNINDRSKVFVYKNQLYIKLQCFQIQIKQ